MKAFGYATINLVLALARVLIACMAIPWAALAFVSVEVTMRMDTMYVWLKRHRLPLPMD